MSNLNLAPVIEAFASLRLFIGMLISNLSLLGYSDPEKIRKVFLVNPIILKSTIIYFGWVDLIRYFHLYSSI